MSVRGFARSIGVTENAVRTRIKAGKRIAEAVHPDGSLDEDRARTLWFIDLDLERAPRQGKTKKGEGAEGNSALRAQAMEALDINRVKAERELVALARERINLDREEKTSIDRADARRLVASIARLQRDTILQFASRVGPELAAELGVDTRLMVSKLDAAMRNMLIELTKHKLPFQE